MKAEKEFKFIFCSLSSRKKEEDNLEWVGNPEGKEIKGESFDECLERIVEATEAVECEVIPPKITYNQIQTYHVILRTENRI